MYKYQLKPNKSISAAAACNGGQSSAATLALVVVLDLKLARIAQAAVGPENNCWLACEPLALESLGRVRLGRLANYWR